MAHASGNKWVDEVSGVKWIQGKYNYTEITRKFSISDTDARLTNKPYISLTDYQTIYTKTLPSNIDDTEDCTYFIRLKVINTAPIILITTCLDWRLDGRVGLTLIYNHGSYGFCVNNTGFSSVEISTQTPSVNVWHTLTFTRKNGIGHLFVDGELKGKAPVPYLIVKKNQIGTSDKYDINSSDTISCYDEIILIKGQALWTDNFDPDINWGYTWKPYTKDSDNKIKLY